LRTRLHRARLNPPPSESSGPTSLREFGCSYAKNIPSATTGEPATVPSTATSRQLTSTSVIALMLTGSLTASSVMNRREPANVVRTVPQNRPPDDLHLAPSVNQPQLDPAPREAIGHSQRTRPCRYPRDPWPADYFQILGLHAPAVRQDYRKGPPNLVDHALALFRSTNVPSRISPQAGPGSGPGNHIPAPAEVTNQAAITTTLSWLTSIPGPPGMSVRSHPFVIESLSVSISTLSLPCPGSSRYVPPVSSIRH